MKTVIPSTQFHGAGVHVHLPMKRWGTTKVQAGGEVPSRTALTAWYPRQVASPGCACELVSTFVATANAEPDGPRP